MGYCVKHGQVKVERRRRDGRARFVCLVCEAARLKRHRDSGNRKPDDPIEKAARKAVENALLRGDLVRKPCKRCGASNAQAHHEDYSKPLDVTWLCPKDHKARHREMRCEAA